MPSLRALECLLVVVDTGSVSAGAQRLHLSQPALSHQLANLERELETRLLERRPRGVGSTAAGRAMVADARVAVRRPSAPPPRPERLPPARPATSDSEAPRA